MSSSLRARSASRSRVIKHSDLFKSGKSLDPIALLSDLLEHVKSLDIPLAVKITDGINEVTYLLSVLISKEYEVIDEKVKFGFKRLDIKSLKATISFDVALDDE